MWGERMAGDKEGCLKLVLLWKNTSENTALVLQCIFCIIGYRSELSCGLWSTNYEHLTFVSRSSPSDPPLAPAASIDTIQQRLCWLLESSECSYYKLGFGRWAFASLPLVVWGIAASRCPFCSSAKNAWLAVSRRECLSLSCSKYDVWYLSSLFPSISSLSCTISVTFQALCLLTVRSILFP